LASFLLFYGNINAQTPKSYGIYLEIPAPTTSLEEALLNPDSVLNLRLRKQKLDSVPPVIKQFKNLEVLDLRKNKIDSLPTWIGEMQSLKVLVLSKNRLAYLPDEICLLKNLFILQVGENELVEVPVGINNLTNLEFLDLWSNNLQYLPPTVEDLKELKVLDVRVLPLKLETQDAIRAMLPNTKIYFSIPCDVCGD